mgnify:CR=1 FL=1
MELSKIAAAIEQDEPTTRGIISDMMTAYEKQNRGIRIIELDHSFQLCTKKEYYDYLIRIARQPKRYVLTDVMLETLSIIAYRQPVTKLEIEKIRGVKSDHAVNKLVEYGLVEEVGRMPRADLFYLGQPRNFFVVSVFSLLMIFHLLLLNRLSILKKKQKTRPS